MCGGREITANHNRRIVRVGCVRENQQNQGGSETERSRTIERERESVCVSSLPSYSLLLGSCEWSKWIISLHITQPGS